MSFNVILCHFVTFRVILCHFMSFYVILCHFMSFYVISCHSMSFHVILCHFVSFHVILCHFMSLHAILCHFMSFHVISCHFVSFGDIPCHSMSFYVEIQIGEVGFPVKVINSGQFFHCCGVGRSSEAGPPACSTTLILQGKVLIMIQVEVERDKLSKTPGANSRAQIIFAKSFVCLVSAFTLI